MSEKEAFMNYVKKLPGILDETGVADTIPKAHTQYIELSLKSPDVPLQTSVTGDLNLIACSLENFACDLYMNSVMSDAEKMFDEAFILRRNYLSVNQTSDLEQLFFLAVAALGSKRASELRLGLIEHEIGSVSSSNEWPELVKSNIVNAFLLLCRKSGGWADINSAVKSIVKLRELQKEFEQKYLEQIKEYDIQFKLSNIGTLVALYNLARIVEIAGTYLIKGDTSKPTVKMKRHYDNAVEALNRSGDTSLEHFVDMVFIGCELLVNNSIWAHTGTLGKKVRELVKELADINREHPFIELWPSQQETMDSGFFDLAKRSIILQMPTSAGKTLMAEFAIVQTHALNPDSTIVYVVPTRALVNQVTLQLRRDLSPLKLVTEAAVPVFELDPTESELLEKKCDILVSTPEKIELLIRTNHPIVRDISLVVVDEVHNISDANRGATLELFLGTISRERKDRTRILLLSPFIPNSDEVGQWLGGDRSTPIRVTWKPSERITAAAVYVGRQSRRHVELVTLPSVHNSDVKEEISIHIESVIVAGSKTKTNVALSAGLSLRSKGGVLLLCSGREPAVQRAKAALRYVDSIADNELLNTTINFVRDELGDNHILPQMLRKGVAFHHAGLSQETRYLIERLVEKGDIKLVCATTTLAQGVNFPIKTVVVEAVTRSTQTSGHQDIPYNEFWNIAGRAGRAMKDHIGLVVFAARNDSDINKYKQYLRGEARNVLSSILDDLTRVTDISERFDRKFVFQYPALARFFQYLLHAIAISDYKTISSEMEEVLRSSLVYHQVSKDNSENARKLIQVARAYLELIKGKADNRPLLELIDGTGFSSISVDFLWARRDEFRDVNLWDSKSLFSLGDPTLKNMIEVLSHVPELTLARFSKGKLDIEAIAEIIKEWVGGSSVSEIADRYFSMIEDRDERTLQTSRYVHNILVGQLAWGMSALQKVSLFGQKDVDWPEIGHVPALMYYGVSSKDEATLRMMGVPRYSTQKLSKKFIKNFEGKSPSFQDIRRWLDRTDNKDWIDPKKKSKLTGEQAKHVWKTLNGLI